MADVDAHSGRIIYINGASSAGKTSIARELQGLLDEPFIHTGIDTFIAAMPPRLFGAEDGWRFIPDGDGALKVEMGAFAQRALGAMYESVAALVRAGNNVIFDDVLTLHFMCERLLRAWHALPVTLVGVRCDPDVAEARERARGNRAIGLARGSSGRAHALIEYDVEVDSGTHTPGECAETILAFTRSGGPRVLARLYAGLA